MVMKINEVQSIKKRLSIFHQTLKQRKNPDYFKK